MSDADGSGTFLATASSSTGCLPSLWQSAEACRHLANSCGAYSGILSSCPQCDVYGQDSGYSERVLLIYDGALGSCGEGSTESC